MAVALAGKPRALAGHVGQHGVQHAGKAGLAQRQRHVDALHARRYRQAAIGDDDAVGVAQAGQHAGDITVQMTQLFHAACSCKKVSSAAKVGMPPCAPGCVTDKAPAAAARRTASVRPRCRKVASAPLKVSPAPVVSTGVTAKPGWCCSWPPASAKKAPSAPCVITTPPAALATISRHGCWLASVVASSNSLGVSTLTRASSAAGNATAGAGFSMNGLP